MVGSESAKQLLVDAIKNDNAILEAISTLKTTINEDAWTMVQDLICQICWKFTHRYGGDFYEWLSEANVAFIEHYPQYEESRSQITTWCHLTLKWKLYDVLRQRIGKRGRRLTFISLTEVETNEGTIFAYQHTKHVNSIATMIECASDAAYEMWQLICSPPDEIANELIEDAPDASLDVLRWYCQYRLRWPVNRIQQAIDELREICE